MKQGIRFFVRPGTFFNQLQWSTHHWFIVTLFSVTALAEAYFGKQHHFFLSSITYLQTAFHLTLNQALWTVIAGKLGFMFLGASLLSWVVWFLGSVVGSAGSRRVLSRRLAVVFSVLLAGYTAQHLAAVEPLCLLLAFVLYGWGTVLGYHAVRGQFQLRFMESVIFTTLLLFLVTTSFHYSNHVLRRWVTTEIAKRSSPHSSFSHGSFEKEWLR